MHCGALVYMFALMVRYDIRAETFWPWFGYWVLGMFIVFLIVALLRGGS